MTAEYPLSGLMNPSENDVLQQLKREIYGTDKPLKSIRQRIGELVPEDRSTLVSIAKIVLAFQQARVTSDAKSKSKSKRKRKRKNKSKQEQDQDQE